MKRSKFNIDVTSGIDTVVWKSINDAIQNRNTESFIILTGFIEDVLLLSIERDSLSNYIKYINFPPSYINVSHKSLKENISYNDIHSLCAKRALELFKYILNNVLSYPTILNNSSVSDKEIKLIRTLNQYIYFTINSFNRLLYNTIQIQSLQDFKNCYSSFTRINNFHNNDILRRIRTEYYICKESEKEDEDIRKLKNIYFEIKKHQDFVLHAKIGLRYWVLYLYSVKKNDLVITKELFNLIENPLAMQELIKEIIFLRDEQFKGYLEWTNWDYMERESGVTYSPPDPWNWLAFGFFTDLIRNGIDSLRFYQYSYKEKRDLTDLYNSFVDRIAFFRLHFNDWNDLINCESVEELESRFQEIEAYFNGIKKNVNLERIVAVSSADLDATKVEDFSSKLNKVVKSNSLFISIMKEVDSKEKNFNPLELYSKHYFADLKGYFINGKHSYEFFGMESSLGQQFSEYIDDNVISFLITKKNKVICAGTKLSEALSSGISNLEKLGEKITSAIVTSEDFYNRYDRFDSNKYFIRNDDSENRFLVGKFKNIDIYLTNSRYCLGKILFLNFDTIRLELHKLETNVKVLTEEEIELEFLHNLDRWNKDSTGGELEKNNSKAMIKNGVNISLTCSVRYNSSELSGVFVAEINR